MAGQETPGAAEARIPAAAAAITDLLNSRAHATPALPDTLDDPGTATELLSRFGEPDGTPPSQQQLDRIRAVRSDLMAVVSPSGPDDMARGWTNLTNHASTVLFRQTFSPPAQVQLRRATGDPVVAGIISAVADLVAAGAWSRVRACANELCGRAFYDTTRSRTQRWHSYEICGNRSNVAAYRARKTNPATAD
jgi:hypothetical protein